MGDQQMIDRRYESAIQEYLQAWELDPQSSLTSNMQEDIQTVQTMEIPYPQSGEAIYEIVKQTKMLNGYSMRWYLFFVRVLSILWLILGPINLMSAVSNELYEFYGGSYQTYFFNEQFGFYNMVIMIVFWIGEILLFIARNELKSFSRLSWQLIIAVFSLSLASSLFTLIMFIRLSPPQIIGAVSGPILVHSLNLVYFVKRRSLFVH